MPPPELAGARVLVTGAAGFVGASLTRALLAAGAEVHALVRPEPPPAGRPELPPEAHVHAADLRGADAVARALAAARPEVVFHLAAAAGHPADAAGRAAALADTVLATANLLEALRAAPARLVHVGGGLEYGHGDGPLAETRALDPATFRGAVKGAATLLAREYAHATGAPVTVLRPFAVYGPWERPPRFVPAVVLAALRGDPIRLTRPGIGRDYVFVADVAAACLLAATVPEAIGEVVNVGTGRLTTNEELVARLAAVSGRELDVRAGAHEERAWDGGFWTADVRRAREVLGWTPAHDLDAGLAATLAWFAEREAAVGVPA